jgi:hypothetical protein
MKVRILAAPVVRDQGAWVESDNGTVDELLRDLDRPVPVCASSRR